MSSEILAILMFVALLVGIFMGHYLAFVIGGLAVIFGFIALGPEIFPLFATRIYTIMCSYILVAVPLFIFMGCMLERSGLADTLYSGMHLWTGGLKGGLTVGTIIICTLMAATTGIIGASVVMGGLLALPPMLKRGYQKELSLGTIAAGGTLGILIPPSIMLILYASQAGLSAGKLFAGAVSPGLLLSSLYIVYILARCYINPNLGPPLSQEERAVHVTLKLRLAVKGLIPVLFLIMAVLGTIFVGIATPTEASGAGAFGSIIIAAAFKKLNWTNFRETVYRSLQINCMVITIILGATCFTSVFLTLGGERIVADLLFGVGGGRVAILAITMLIFLVLGCFLDWIGALMIFLPIFLPISGELGFNPLWFALLVCINLQMSFLTPPFGYALFYLKGITPEGVTMAHIYRGIIPFVTLQALAIALCVIFPEIILWLPAHIVL